MEELTAMIKNLQNKFDEQTNELRDMKQSIPQIINNNIDTKFANLEYKYTTLEKTVEEQGRRIQQLERVTRKKNLIFFGIEENERSYYDLQNKILEIINQYMKIECYKENIEEVRRLGKKQVDGKIRPTSVTLNTMGTKIELLKNKKTLNGSPYYIKEDFPPDILEERKRLTTQMLEERNKGRKAFLKYDKLVVIPDEKKGHEKNPNQNSNKRNRQQSPETIASSSSLGKNNRKQPFKKPCSDMQQYIIRSRNPNWGPRTDSLPTTSAAATAAAAAAATATAASATAAGAFAVSPAPATAAPLPYTSKNKY